MISRRALLVSGVGVSGVSVSAYALTRCDNNIVNYTDSDVGEQITVTAPLMSRPADRNVEYSAGNIRLGEESDMRTRAKVTMSDEQLRNSLSIDLNECVTVSGRLTTVEISDQSHYLEVENGTIE